jgi:hypothetical protein
MTDASKAQLFFDKEYKIRVLDPTKYEKSEQLEKECGNFVEKINGFNERIVSLAEILDAHAQRIDAQKLRVPLILLSLLRKPLFAHFFSICRQLA